MIFATVGTQLPFPRFLKLLDQLAGKHKLQVFAQTADRKDTLINIAHRDHLSPQEFQAYAQRATKIVGHAGIGTVLTGLRLEKPLILFPRRAELMEHRNDHQMATARALEGRTGVYIAWSDAAFEELITRDNLETGSMVDGPKREQLIRSIQLFLADAI